MPQNVAGTLTDPPTSVPSPKTDPWQPTIAASPPDDPPGLKFKLYGFFDRPMIRLFVSKLFPN